MGKKIILKKKPGGIVKFRKPAPADESSSQDGPAPTPRVDKIVLGKKKPLVGSKPVKKKAIKGVRLAELATEAAPEAVPETVAEDLPSSTHKSIMASKSDVFSEDSLFRFYCYRCGQKLKVRSSSEGDQKTCPRCQSTITVPSPPEG